jgi:hypothetical protein
MLKVLFGPVDISANALTRNGKPAARRGRKARGLTKIAQLPKLLNASS